MGDEQGLPQRRGLHDITITLDARPVKVTVAVPDVAAAQRPLIMALHYGGPPSGYYARPLVEALIEPALRTLQPVIVAPVSIASDWTQPENVAMVRSLAEFAEQTYGTDQRRRVICGYSLGAIGTWHMLTDAPEYFSAAIPIAGFKPVGDVSITTPVMAFHSDTDELFALADLEQMIAALNEGGARVKLETLEGVGHYDVGGFAASLAGSVPWLESLWRESATRT